MAAYAVGPDTGLAALQTLAGEKRLARYAPYHAEREYLTKKLRACESTPRAAPG